MRFRHSMGIAIAVGALATSAHAQDPEGDGTQGSGTGYERELRDQARREQASLRHCLEGTGQKTPRVIDGLQFVSVSIGPDGTVSHVTFHGQPDVVAPLEMCVNRITANWRLSSPRAGPATVDLNRDQLLQGANWIRAH